MPELTAEIVYIEDVLIWTFSWLILISLNGCRLLYKIFKSSKTKKVTVEDAKYVLASNVLLSAGFILFAPWYALVVIVVALALGTASMIILLNTAYPDGGEIN